MEYPSCALCGSNDSKQLVLVDDIKTGSKNTYQLVQCNCCGLIYLSPRPTMQEMPAYYDKTYGPHAAAYSNAAVRNEGGDLYYHGRVRQLTDNIPKITGRLLDVGCGDGYWLNLMQKQGWKTTGVEISRQAAGFAHESYGLDVRPGTLLEQNFPAQNFNVITFWHSLEHLHNPKESLREAYRIMQDGGNLVIQVPNIDNILFRIFKGCYSMIQAPYHLYHFSPSTLKRLLEQNNFETYHIAYSSGIDGIALSLKNWGQRVLPLHVGQTHDCGFSVSSSGHAERNVLAWFKRKVVLPALKPAGELLAAARQGDVFTVYAKKRVTG